MFYLCVNLWRLLRRGLCEKKPFRKNARLPEGVAGLTKNLKTRKFIISEKNNKKRLGMPRSPRLPPFRLRYGGVLADKLIITEFGRRYRLR
jgi:hypothetical protein